MWRTEFAKPTGPAVGLFVCLLPPSCPVLVVCLCWFVCSCVQLVQSVQSVRLFLARSFVRSFVRSLVRSFVRSFVRSGTASFRASDAVIGLPRSISWGFVFYNLCSSAVTGVHHGR